MYRLFVAVDFPEEVKNELSSFCFGLPGARWVDDQQFHLTLHFVGEVDGRLFEDISEGLEDVKQQEFDLQLSGLGFFPPRKNPKVLWVGVAASQELLILHGKIGAVLKRVGVTLEKRRFSPHVTLARLKNTPYQKVASFLVVNNLYKSSPFKIGDFKLYSSIVTSKGATHNVEKCYRLAAL